MNIQRLQLLVVLLEEIRDRPNPGKLFNLSTWAVRAAIDQRKVPFYGRTLALWASSSNRPEILKEGFCGTSACAVGHACLDPRFNALGLGLDSGGVYPAYEAEEGVTLLGWKAARAFFGLDHSTAEYLFNANSYPEEESTQVQAVIDRVVNLLTGAENSEQEHSPCP